MAGREHRLVLRVGEDAEGVLARHVVRRQDGHEPWHARLDRRQIAQRELRARMRGADDAHPKRIGGSFVGAEQVGAGHLGPAVDPMQPRPDGATRGCLGRTLRGQPAGHVHDRIDDLVVAGAAAQHAADAVGDLGARRRRRAVEQVGCGHQHAGSADAALRGAVLQERAAQALGQPARANAFDGLDRRAAGLRRRHQAGAHLLAVEEHGAGAAVARLAADLGSGEAELVAQRVGKRCERSGDSRDRPPVQREADGDGLALRHALLHHAALRRDEAVSPRSRSRVSASAASRR